MHEMNIAVLDEDGFQTFFGSAASAFEECRVSLHSLCFTGEFQRYFEGFYMCSLICRELITCALGRNLHKV